MLKTMNVHNVFIRGRIGYESPTVLLTTRMTAVTFRTTDLERNDSAL